MKEVSWMGNDSIVSFFDALLEDEIEKKIIKLISQGLEEEEIIDNLLGVKKEEV